MKSLHLQPAIHSSITHSQSTCYVMIWSTMLGVQQGTRRAWRLLWSSWRWPNNRRDWGLTDNLTKQVSSNVRSATSGKVHDPIKYLVVRKKWHLRRNPEGWIGCGRESRQREQNVLTLWDRTGVGTQVGTERDPSPGESTETRDDKVIPEVREAQAAKIQFVSPFLRN